MTPQLATGTERLLRTRLYTFKLLGYPSAIASGGAVLARMGAVVAQAPVAKVGTGSLFSGPLRAFADPPEPGATDPSIQTVTWLASDSWIENGNSVGQVVTNVLVQSGGATATGYTQVISERQRTHLLAAVAASGGPRELGAPIEETFRAVVQAPLDVASDIAQELYDASQAVLQLGGDAARGLATGANKTLELVEDVLKYTAIVAGVGLALYALQGGTLAELSKGAKSLGKAVMR